jgi:desulfoferrodoxin (superoxide reductase-like protein)|tara:strand:+ start:141 stop:494 length:354 start_codon:yes stop_codon:yes gene_type:complete
MSVNATWVADALAKEAGGVFSPSAPGKWAGKEGGHTPVIVANADGSVTVSTPHGMADDHWIEYVYAKDASGAVVAIANFTGAGAAASVTFTPAGAASEIQPFSFCNKHNTWQGVSLA